MIKSPPLVGVHKPQLRKALHVNLSIFMYCESLSLASKALSGCKAPPKKGLLTAHQQLEHAVMGDLSCGFLYRCSDCMGVFMLSQAHASPCPSLTGPSGTNGASFTIRPQDPSCSLHLSPSLPPSLSLPLPVCVCVCVRACVCV